MRWWTLILLLPLGFMWWGAIGALGCTVSALKLCSEYKRDAYNGGWEAYWAQKYRSWRLSLVADFALILVSAIATGGVMFIWLVL